ncbi:MAG: hypothetical protein GQ535_12335 [Rhodobacteraceae bacterium]|nr:hypothetical protein [Paracoccaceae bacterium]
MEAIKAYAAKLRPYTPFIRMSIKVLSGAIISDGVAADATLEYMTGVAIGLISVGWYLAEKRGWL